MALIGAGLTAAMPANADPPSPGTVLRGSPDSLGGIIVQENSPFDLRRRTPPVQVQIYKLRRAKLRRSLSEFSMSAGATLALQVYEQALATGSTNFSVTRRRPSRLSVERGNQSRLLVGKRNPALFTRRFRSRSLRMGMAIGLSLAQVELRRREEAARLAAEQEAAESVREVRNPRTLTRRQIDAGRADPAMVTEIQRALQRFGYEGVRAGRGLTTQTVGAISTYQADNQLLVDGVPSAALLEHMLAQEG